MSDTKTSTPYGHPGTMIQQAVGVFHTCMQRRTTLNRLTGKMPTEADAVAGTKRQTKPTMPIVRAEDLGKGKGDEVEFQLDQPIGSYPIMGSEFAEGKGVGMSYENARFRVNQARFPIDMGDQMSRIRTPYDLRKFGRPKAQRLMDDYIEHSTLVHLAGARGFNDHLIEWRVPLASHPKFSEIMVNRVKAPTRNRHLVAGAGAVGEVKANAGELVIASSDTLSMDVVDAVRSWMDQIPLPPPPVEFDEDLAATDSPIRVLLASPAQYSGFATDPNFRAFQGNAMARARLAKDHPLFLGEAGLWNGILIIKMPKAIRFYAGDELRYCASYTSEQESSVLVPASFTDKYAVDRAILLGGQALGQAFGRSDHSGVPFFWKEAPGDFDDKMEIAIGAILGMSKIRFAVSHGDTKQFTDHGVTVLDTAVPIIKPRG
ncbi:DUF4043 family protein [Delftia acidovorans]|uniref:phage capsid family protein n=1 Tax=Delftia acidovorans TaxID=80866 RepID=UPI00333E29D6